MFLICSETFCVRNKCFPVCAAQETSWATMCPQQCVLVCQGLKGFGKGAAHPHPIFLGVPPRGGPLSTVVSTGARELEQNALIYFPFLGQCFLLFQLIHIFSGCNLVLLIIIKRPLSSVIRSSFPLTTSISVNNSATTTVWQYIDCCTYRGNIPRDWNLSFCPVFNLIEKGIMIL